MFMESIPEVNFSFDEYAEFLKTLNDVKSYESCGEITIDPVVLKVSGGVKRKGSKKRVKRKLK